MLTVHPGCLVGELDVSHELVFHRGADGVVPLFPDVQQLLGAPRVGEETVDVGVELEVAVSRVVVVVGADLDAAVRVFHLSDEMVYL